MNKQQFDEAKHYAAEIDAILKDVDLTEEERRNFELIRSGLAGALLQNWLPFGLVRRSIMAALFLVGMFGILPGHHYFLFAFVGALTFSPRATGEIAFNLGKIAGLLR